MDDQQTDLWKLEPLLLSGSFDDPGRPSRANRGRIQHSGDQRVSGVAELGWTLGPDQITQMINPPESG